VAATGGLAQATALATADPLARPFRAGLRLQVVQADLLGARGLFVSCSESFSSALLPIRPSFSAFKVAF
jgi:hypothetical protein